MRSKLSALGMYNYEPSIFEELRVPGNINRADVISSILLETAELDLMYREPETMKSAVGLWSRSMMPSWERQLRAITEEYNPIHNFDRHEEWRENGSAEGSGHSEGNSSSKVAGFDTGSMTPKDSATSASDSSSQQTNATDHSGHLYGNIGVQTSASMVAEEVRLRSNLSMIKLIVDDFKKNFCILVY